MMERLFDYWLAKKVLNLLNEGYSLEQTKIALNLIFSDISDCIDDKNILNLIKDKMNRTIEIFIMGEQK